MGKMAKKKLAVFMSFYPLAYGATEFCASGGFDYKVILKEEKVNPLRLSSFGWMLLLAFGFWFSNFAYATSSTTFWTPSVMDVQPYGVWHITYDNYFTVGKKGNKAKDFPTDVGLTVGVLPYEKLNLEVGYDLLEPTDDPSFFNAKLGTPENSLFNGSPGLNVGIFNVGTRKDVTDYDILYFVAGKTLPLEMGRIHLGYYTGITDTLKDASTDGEGANSGFMIGWDKGICPVNDDKGKFQFNRFVLAADFATGKNAIGGGGVGIYTYFTKDISLLTGPVCFNDTTLNGDMKWTIQLDINFKF